MKHAPTVTVKPTRLSRVEARQAKRRDVERRCELARESHARRALIISWWSAEALNALDRLRAAVVLSEDCHAVDAAITAITAVIARHGPTDLTGE